MKSKIKFEINKSDKEVNFLHVTVGLDNGSIRTSIYRKPTDALVSELLFKSSKACSEKYS